ncbi:Fungalysin metallopeptidase-domain-containing protein [Lactarius hengduanensis]|nr:Fungalysin metallopeptidase-domain-containing protein [Lactarius hengduanensis]
MVSFTKLLAPAFFAFLSVRTASATPWPSPIQHNTHRTHYIGADRSLKLEAFHPESIFERFGVEGVDPLPTYPRHPRDILNIGDIVLHFLESKLGISKDNILLRAIVQGEAAQYAFLAQKIEKALKGTYNGHNTTLEFVVQPNGYAALSHVIQIQNDTAGTWYEAFIDAHNNTLLSVTDFVARASYRVLPIHEQDPTQGFQTVIDPQDMSASPNGWHQEFSTTTNLTAGNNAIAYKGSQLIEVTVQTSAVLNFIYDVDLTKSPSSGTNVQAATTNAFYVVNTFHDFTYKYGFTETTFNFQTNNFNEGGEGFDRILVSVQDDSGTNDAIFATPPDGQSGTMQLYLYVNFSPRRDSALQNDLVIHECQHGASNRMTGGGTARCFQTSESAGVAEGYADAMADWVSQGSTTADFVFGQYASKSSTGLRNYAYSTSDVTNPLRYSSLKGMTDAHDMGEVWANTLHNVYAALVIAEGWSMNALTDPTTNEGNVVWLHLFIDALLLQPCNPTCEDFSFGPYSAVFSCVETDTEWTVLNARDAWIQADANRYKGAHTCLLWATFASRGFGVNATNFVDDVSYPPDCNC